MSRYVVYAEPTTGTPHLIEADPKNIFKLSADKYNGGNTNTRTVMCATVVEAQIVLNIVSSKLKEGTVMGIYKV